jgi:hypothetical protein
MHVTCEALPLKCWWPSLGETCRSSNNVLLRKHCCTSWNWILCLLVCFILRMLYRFIGKQYVIPLLWFSWRVALSVKIRLQRYSPYSAEDFPNVSEFRGGGGGKSYVALVVKCVRAARPPKLLTLKTAVTECVQIVEVFNIPRGIFSKANTKVRVCQCDSGWWIATYACV